MASATRIAVCMRSWRLFDELRRQLAQEQEVRADALDRVDRLLKRIEGSLAHNEVSAQA